MTPDSDRFQDNSKNDEQVRGRVPHGSWEEQIRLFVGTPGRISMALGLLVGLALAFYFGLVIGGANIKSVVLLSGGLISIFLLVVAGEYWWSVLVFSIVLGVSTTELGFKINGAEAGFVAMGVAFLARRALKAIKQFRPAAGLGAAFWALFLYLLIHATLVLVYNRYEAPGALKNLVRGYFATVAPLVFFFLVGRYCNPKTVKPVTAIYFGGSVLCMLVALPMFIFKPTVPFLNSAPVSFAWLDPNGAGGVLRGAPILANFAIALWAASRVMEMRWFFLGMYGFALVAAAASSGRLAFAGVILIFGLYVIMNRRWGTMICGLIATGLLILIATNSPELVERLPNSAQRALSPLNLGDHFTKRENELSDRWHREIREDSFKYWTETWYTFLVGHGYGTWDYSLSADEDWTRDFEYAKKMAVQMGRTENVFSSTTNIFGLTGLLLYLWFMIDMTKRLLVARKVVPAKSFERAMCDMSLVSIAAFVVLAPFAGGAPGWEIFYWQLGLLAARPYLKSEEEKAGEALRAPLSSHSPKLALENGAGRQKSRRPIASRRLV